jgi:hypothetical protein
VNGFLTRMGCALVAGVIGLSMAFYSLERLSLINLATSLDQDDGKAPLSVTASLFAGLALLNAALFYAVSRWAKYLRTHPRTSQAPAWLLIAIFTTAGAAMVWALATHAGWLRLQDAVPVSVNWGYIAFQVVAASLVLVSLVLLAARWSPGYKTKVVEA